jgi:hypothetical protein
MLYARFKVYEFGKPSNIRFYDGIEELVSDYALENDEMMLVYKGKDLEKAWAKKRWVISIDDPDKEE